MAYAIEGMTSVTMPITSINLPEGLMFEQDGSIWSAERCEPHPLTGKDWRWKPMNFKAFAKPEPTGEMLDAAFQYLKPKETN